ncbi:hypothetical protein [Solihabitans fulvus]|uniref:hypothetical protein n=1 Tax=Solihabitans fulvus TaxID=1892852 RepID=UPI001661F908|nr:hypothetical protein [Solihabitans fulvus]
MPAAMTLLGRLNWWAPRGLCALHRRFGRHEVPEAATVSASEARTEVLAARR